MAKLTRIMAARELSPPRLLILSFTLLIMVGTLLLWLPFSAATTPLSFLDALFTAASGVCVTGLAVIDLGRDLSRAGQVVTLLLFQLGGLGIITFSVVLFGLLGGNVSFKSREVCQTAFLPSGHRDFFIIMKRVLLFTFLLEAVGTVLLFIPFSRDYPHAEAFFLAVYHAVSAFVNCGYSLFSSSLTAYREDMIVNITVMLLVILGGIGFIVHHEILSFFQENKKKLSLHSRIVLIVTAVLLMLGACSFYLFEGTNVLRDVPVSQGLLVSFFQSVTARTCGFNTIEIGNLTNATLLVLMFLMFIGASPGSTGGGIKTTSLAILFLIFYNRLKGSSQVNVFSRTIPRDDIGRTVSLVLAAMLFIGVVTSALLLSAGEVSKTVQEERHLFLAYLFETISAFGTVGLSLGTTAQLNDLQKIIIIVTMFIGRLGPLTLAFAWYDAKRSITYAEESVMTG